ncbi:beta-N-acetylhexosaminidase family protein [Halobacillus hunanensis]|uniref:beta-N-acetylhexosaminidase family protein n=1 Tax=Halobacillus hunanensis TaxID=578214 RepID=UPI001FEAF12E|nr:beta-N-acetylglucosaminidase domain-containing protein [Halobacillus hunanensis]
MLATRQRLFFGMFVLFIASLMMVGYVHAEENEEDSKLGINPKPQEVKKLGEGFPLTPVVGLVVGENTDEAAVREVKQALKEAEVKRIVRKTAGESAPNTPITIWIGGPSENSATVEVLKNSEVEGPEELQEEGYVFVSQNKTKKQIVLAGKDKAGTFYAAQTFEQIIKERKGRDWIPAVEIRDWPDMDIRGSIEGFYGPPWSHEDRLSQLEFYSENKMNAYIYAPKDDPYHREKWREPYPAEELSDLQELVDKANDNHIEFTFSLSPGNTVCYSGDQDFELLMDKMEAVWDLGVRSYAIFLDDISYDLHCEQDKEKFGDEADPTAAAQAYLLNRFNQEFIQTHEGAERLITVPTDYAGNHTNTYRKQFAELVHDEIVVMWTGPAVVPEEITSEGAAKVSEIFQHDLLIWDNYPVNDFERNRLFLGPLVKRDADLTENGVIGLTANPMNEAEASKIPLYTIADYTWNSYAYDPKESWERSIQSFGGDAANALRTFAENSYSSRITDKESLTLSPLIEEFWAAYESADAEQAAENLIAEFENIQTVPERLRENMDNKRFLEEVDPYLEKLKLSGEAGVIAVQLLMAEKAGDSGEAEQYREKLMAKVNELEEIPQQVGKFVVKPFLFQAIYGEYVLSRPLDGVNKFRGAGELIQYTPEHGDTTGTNIYGYEVTVVEGKVVKRGGNNSPIPDNGYVLSIHGSDWLMENALMGAEVDIKDGRVLITIPK